MPTAARENRNEILCSLSKQRRSNTGQVETGGVFFLRAALLLHISGGQTLVHGIVDHPAVFVGGDPPPDAVFGRFVKGGVLAHDAGQKAARVSVVPCSHLVENGKTVVDVAGQGEMPQDHALLQDALGIEYRMPGLPQHFLDGGFCLREVIRRGRKIRREGRGYIFQISQPDVDIPVPCPDALDGLVSAGVADDGEGEPLRPRCIQRREDPWPPLPGGDEVDVVGTLPLQVEEDLRQVLHRDLFAETLGTDGIILAEAAFQGAAGEEHGSAAAGAADAGFLPEVQGSAGGFQGRACAAKAGLPGSTVGAAPARAERTGRRRGDRKKFRHIVQVL